MFSFKKRLKKAHLICSAFLSLREFGVKIDKNATLHVASIYCYKHFFCCSLSVGLKHFNCIFRRLTTFMPQSPFNSFALFCQELFVITSCQCSIDEATLSKRQVAALASFWLFVLFVIVNMNIGAQALIVCQNEVHKSPNHWNWKTRKSWMPQILF